MGKYTFEALLPCPFCDNKVGITTGNIGKEGIVLYIKCSKCGLQTNHYTAKDDTPEELGNAVSKIFMVWNKRAEKKEGANEKNKTE